MTRFDRAPAGTDVSEVRSDAALARLARTTLAAAEHGTVMLGTGRPGSSGGYRVHLADDDGEPLLCTRADAAVDRAAQERRLGGLQVAPSTPGGVALRLVGRLAMRSGARGPRVPPGCGCETPDGSDRLVVRVLQVERVIVACPHPVVRGRPESERELPLDVYAGQPPDQVLAAVPRIVRHLNDDHAEQLRERVARWVRPPSQVLAAQIADVSGRGLRVDWVDETGGGQRQFCFARPAGTVEELLAAMRGCLNA